MAQAYFAVRTREAETASVRKPTGPELMAMALIEAAETIKAAGGRVLELESTVTEQRAHLRLVEPKAEAFDRWLSANVNYSADQVAKAIAATGVTKLPNGRTLGRGMPLAHRCSYSDSPIRQPLG